METATGPELHVDDVRRILQGMSAAELSPDGVRQRLEGIAVSADSLRPYVHFRKGRYTRNLVHRDERFELLALCWDEGTCSPIHNHSGQDCWFLVHEGRFCFEGYRIVEGGTEPGHARLEQDESTHRVGRGALDHRGPDHDVHRVIVSKGSVPAVSLHVYAKPFDECLVYDLKSHRCQRLRLQYHSVGGRLCD